MFFLGFKAITSILKLALVVFFSSLRSAVVNSCPENPFRICFDIQLDLHEPACGCQPNFGLIRALCMCGCVSPADSTVLEISWLVPRNSLSPDGLLGGFNSFFSLLEYHFSPYAVRTSFCCFHACCCIRCFIS